MSVPVWLSVVTFALAILGVIGGALATIRSKYRDSADTEREKYITALEARNKLLEETVGRQTSEIKTMERKHHNLEGKVCTLQELVLRQCRRAEINPVTGGCKHCALGMAYGQGGAP